MFPICIRLSTSAKLLTSMLLTFSGRYVGYIWTELLSDPAAHCLVIVS